jgi:CAI-1 autoinducer synthase
LNPLFSDLAVEMIGRIKQDEAMGGYTTSVLPAEHFSFSEWEKKTGLDFIDLTDNDYFCLNSHENAKKAQLEEVYNPISLQSELFKRKDTSPITPLREKFKTLLNASDVIFSTSGYTANIVALSRLAGENTPVYLDIRSHESWLEAGQLTKGKHLFAHIANYFRNRGKDLSPTFEEDFLNKVKTLKLYAFPHNRADKLESYIRRYGAGIVIVEGLYSVEGDIVNPEVVKVAKENDCVVVIDESHSLGGTTGEAFTTTEALGLDVDVITGSLSKAIASHGGFVALRPTFFERYFRQEAKERGKAFTQEEKAHYHRMIVDFVQGAGPLVFSNAIGSSRTILARINTLLNEEAHRPRLVRDVSAKIRTRLKNAGVDINSQSPMIFIDAGSQPQAVAFRNRLLEDGVMGSLYIPPATPRKGAGVRFVLNYDFCRNEEFVERFITAILTAKNEIKIKKKRT